MSRNESPGRTVTSKVLAVLAAFDAGSRELSLTDLAQRADLPVATAHRLVGELLEWGALDRTTAGGYAVGRRLWDLGLLAPVNTDLRSVAAPFLQDLHAATRATVQLAVRDDDRALYVDRLSGSVSTPVVSRVGSRLPLHATAVGKVLLAHAPDAVRLRVLGSLTRHTPHTVTSPAILDEQLRRARRDGFATTAEEMSRGACSVAVPVCVGDEVVAALGAVVPDLRHGRPELVAGLRVASQGIGRRLALHAAR
ncbi:transcriptional regulator, IclR family [Quadrisphaera granulorum]|uniref:IclR family transcriptional regulator n=1 Tax=Quadrisphaera granulorum TaxID=317664 RepID=A0A316A9P7_9ACTN|nr:IclR family transcriptional regulator [Quadrisphaera granulorum]PWJ54411.1 IclR family transcriptional regulator [Quadrisphaera granulorum]SZE96183.1 transcriptional regulator, IclR family [Quadrisphaera granulorum]